MGGLVATTLVLWGLTAWMPRPDGDDHWAGVRLLAAFCALVIALFAATALHLPLRAAAWTVAAAAAAGLPRAAAGLPRAAAAMGTRWTPLHPALLLPLAAAAALALTPGFAYTPFLGDEVSIWMSWAQSAVDLDRAIGPGVATNHPDYPPGWPLALAFPNLLFGGFDHSRTAPVPLLMHVALLAAVHDVVRAHARRAGVAPGRAALLGWAFILAALAVEATWRLAPANMLVEKPQIYTLAGAAALATLPVTGGVLAAAAMLFATAYLIKTAALAFALPLALMLWARRDGAGWPRVAAVFLPFVAAVVAWRLAGAPRDYSDPTTLLGVAAFGDPLDLALRMAGETGRYLTAFKPWLSLVALLGLAAATPAFPWVTVPLLLYAGLYEGALYLYHLYGLGRWYYENLNSIERFTRVPLRLVHLMGLLLPLLAALPRLAALAERHRRLATIGLAAAVALGGGWQGTRLAKSFRDMTAMADLGPEGSAAARLELDGIRRLDALLAARPDLPRRVALVNAGLPDAPTRIRYHVHGRFAVQDETLAGEPEAVRRRLLDGPLLWLHAAGKKEAALVAPLILEEDCRSRPDRWFLNPRPEQGRLECLARD